VLRGGHDHHRDNQHRGNRRGQAEHDEQSGQDLAQAGREREELPGPVADRFQPAAGPGEPIPAEPAEQFLRAVERDSESNQALKQ
jgi:hypothetical protein